MLSAGNVADGQERIRALDVTKSFIVRAPAGSGKTRLLIQRYLRLLACADEPEEVIAITFTRRAAAEMRARVQMALFPAADATAGADGVDKVTQTAALGARARDAERGWGLAAGPQRLRIMTIDALNASITRQMSITSRFGAQPESLDDASRFYQEAARRLLAKVNDQSDDDNVRRVSCDIATLLSHLDNNLPVVEGLVVDMLRSRDHWLRNLDKMRQREDLEEALAGVRVRAVAAAARAFPPELETETLELMRFSGQNLLKDGVDQALSKCADLTTFPDNDIASLSKWIAVAELLLTNEGGWRKAGGVNKRIGFPTSANKAEKALLGAMKERVGVLLESMAAAPDTAAALATALLRLRVLPPAGYSEAEWQVLGAIMRLLPHATVILWQVFGAVGQCDFTEISQAASRALGDEDAPTDLALSLDYRIQHMLVDEFQDTSFAQFALLEKLTRGWTPDDGRTLFLVGDPMQSIYRFREAEVGLFARATSTGVGSVMLEPLTLRVNFRSAETIVEWVNSSFEKLMPRSAIASEGGVPYSASEAFASDATENADRGVTVHWRVRQDPSAWQDAVGGAEAADPAAAEAQKIVGIIRQSHAQRPAASVAMLVRNRGHLSAIVPAMKAAGIAFNAVDIDPLKNRPVVQDLLALTRALLHLADRVAWLAVLRAPWCGLTIDDLCSLADGVLPHQGKLASDRRTIWEMINDDARLLALSEDGKARLLRMRVVMSAAIEMRRRLPLREAVERIWLAIGAPACLSEAQDLCDAGTYLDLLEAESTAQAAGSQIIDLGMLEMRMDRLFSGSHGTVGLPTANPVQIMTIHKAKGLEFDTVIVPALERAPRHDDKRLMLWSEQPNPLTGMSELLLAPIRETGSDEDTDEIYRYITQLERDNQRQEDVRLLYVAATRAKSRLHLFAALSVKSTNAGAQFVAPRAGSLLASLWPAISPPSIADGAFVAPPYVPLGVGTGATAADSGPRRDRIESAQRASQPRRLVNEVPVPVLPAPVYAMVHNDNDDNERSETIVTHQADVEFDWAGDTVRHVGTVVHAVLQRIADDGVDTWTAARVMAASALFEQELTRRGVDTEACRGAVPRITQALIQTLDDPRGRWILQSRASARSEWRLTGFAKGALINAAIDRSFVDDAGVRWIIDFKTGSHEGADVEAFLDSEQRRYRSQLESYAELVGEMSDDKSVPVRLGLYFPMLRGWREWQ